MSIEQHDKKEGSFLAGLFWGALTGGIAAWLFAPRSGSQTREMLRERSLELKDRFAETTQRVQNFARRR